MIAPSAAPSAATSSGPSLTRIGTTYSGDPGSSWLTNHSRCCANDSGSRMSRPTGTTGAAGGAAWPATAVSITAARPATVGWSNSAAAAMSVPNTSRIREIARVASSECPPSSKKLSSAPTRSASSSTAQIPASSSCTGPDGGTNLSMGASAAPGSGSAALSTLPFGVRGRAASSVNTAGTMNAGSRSPANSRSSAAGGIPAAGSDGTRYAASRSESATTTASRTRGWPASTSSTSPSSTRNPRTLTWPSARPR